MDGHITAFIEYLEFEKGLSLNTRAAYRRDLSKFMAFVREKMANNWTLAWFCTGTGNSCSFWNQHVY
jgi:integrase/recombinase XerD